MSDLAKSYYAGVRSVSDEYLDSVVITRDVTDRRKLEGQMVKKILTREEKVTDPGRGNARVNGVNQVNLVNTRRQKIPTPETTR